jgi:hypothetical protein
VHCVSFSDRGGAADRLHTHRTASDELTPRLSPPPPAFVTLPAAQALPALVLAERSAAGARDLATLRHLCGRRMPSIIDGRGTPDPADDFVWRGRAAILDRYDTGGLSGAAAPVCRQRLP